MSHPASSAVINHTPSHPQGRPATTAHSGIIFQPAPRKVFLSMTGAPQGSGASQRSIWFSCCEICLAHMKEGSLWGALTRGNGGVQDKNVWWPRFEGGSRPIWLERCAPVLFGPRFQSCLCCVSFSKQPDISVPLWEEESETSPKCDDRNRSSGNREVPSAQLKNFYSRSFIFTESPGSNTSE